MLAIIAPGQGSQTPGMFNSWIEDPALKDLILSWSDAIGLDLLRLGTTADADEIKDTANAQPLIVAASLLGAHALGIKNCAVTSGHSVGELAAAALSGAITESDALTIVRARGIEMAKAAASAVVPRRKRSRPIASDHERIKSFSAGSSSQLLNIPGVCEP